MSVSRADRYVNKFMRMLKDLPEPKESDSEQYKRQYKLVQDKVNSSIKQLNDAWFKWLNTYPFRMRKENARKY